MSDYMMFNPHQHLTEAFRVSLRQWESIRRQLTQANQKSLDSGATIRIGDCARMWKRKIAQ